MAVTRRGADEDIPQTMQDLGRVLVTIDDLQALFDVLSDLQGESAPPPVVEFGGGSFDDPVDLKKLSDDELRHLTVKVDQIEIDLSFRNAQAFGQEEACKAVLGKWARARQTTVRAAKRSAERYTSGALLVAVVVLSDVYNLAGPGSGFGDTFDYVLTVAVTIFGVIGLIRGFNRLPKSYAAIQPLTWEEYRKKRSDSNVAWRNTAIALMAVSVTLIIGILGLLLKK